MNLSDTVLFQLKKKQLFRCHIPVVRSLRLEQDVSELARCNYRVFEVKKDEQRRSELYSPGVAFHRSCPCLYNDGDVSLYLCDNSEWAGDSGALVSSLC